MFGMGACGSPAGFGRFAGPPPLMRHLFGAQHGQCGPGAFLSGLDLSDEQLERIAAEKQQHSSKLAHLKIDLVDLHKQLFKELGNVTIDHNKINDLSEKIKGQKALLTEATINKMLAVAEILTPEQRKKVRTSKIRHFLGLDDRQPEEEG